MTKHVKYPAFTIVELLIVIVVIAILAAISIVAYNGIQDRARSSASASSSTQVAKKIKVWQVDNEAISPTCGQFFTIVTSTTSSSSCSFDYNGTNYQYAVGTNGAYCVTTTVADKSYKVSDSTTPQAGGCPGHGQGGVGAVTNLVANSGLETTTMGMNSASLGSFALSTSAAHTGSNGQRFTVSTAGNLNSTGPCTGVVASSGTYAVSAFVRSSRSVSYRLVLVPYDSANVNLGSVVGPTTSLSTNTWTRISHTLNPVANMTRFTLCVYSGGEAVSPGDTIDYDSLMTTQGGTFYGFANGSSADWIWNGTPNNSTSTGPPV